MKFMTRCALVAVAMVLTSCGFDDGPPASDSASPSETASAEDMPAELLDALATGLIKVEDAEMGDGISADESLTAYAESYRDVAGNPPEVYAARVLNSNDRSLPAGTEVRVVYVSDHPDTINPPCCTGTPTPITTSMVTFLDADTGRLLMTTYIPNP